MDRAAAEAGNFANIKRLKRLRQAAYSGVAELLERRMLLSGTPSASAIAAASSAQPWFIQNAGQWADPTVRYALKTDVGSIVMTDQGPVFNVLHGRHSEQFSVHFDGANTVSPTGSGKSKGVYNYLSVGVNNVHGYSQIAYEGLYDGVDLQTWGKKSSLKYEFHVAPGADYSQVQLSYEGIQGLSIDSKGRLHVKTKFGEIVDEAPLVYQNINGKQVEVASSFKLVDSNTYTFLVKGSYDHSAELILDPTITWGTYFGGDAAEVGNSVVVDGSLNIYITGSTSSTDFPLLNAVDGARTGNGTEAFVTKLDVNGDLVWSTYFGGNRADVGQGIEISHDGSQVYVAGTTASSDTSFPDVSDGFQPVYAGGNNEGFVAVFLADGTYSWGSYLGTTSGDTVTSTYLDANGMLYVTGQFNAPIGFVAKINPDPSSRALISETQIGTTGNTVVQGVTVSNDGLSFYVIGDTTASDFVAIGRPKDQNRDAFIAAYDVIGLNQPTAELWIPRWTRYLGGEGADTGGAIALNAAGVIAVTGTTASDEFPVSLSKSAHADTLRGGNSNDAFLALYDTDGFERYVSFVGGNLADAGNGIIVDGSDKFILVGTSASIDLPFQNSFGGQFRNNGGNDAFYGVFDNKGQFSILDEYGGTGGDTGLDIAVDSLGAIYIVGTTSSTDLNQGPVVEAPPGEIVVPPRTNLGSNDAYVVRIALNVQAAPPSAPVNLQALAQSDGSIRLTWGDLSSTESGFKIYRSTSNTIVGNFGSPIFTTGPGATSYTDRDVDPGVTYYYYVTSFIGALQNASNIAQATTGSSTVKAPSDLTATAISGTRVALTWRDNSTNESSFEIWRQVTADDVWQLIDTVPAGSTDYDDQNGLTSGVTYAYRIRAINAIRVSTFTEPVVVTTRAGNFVVAPSDANANRISDTAVVITWQDNSTNETGFVVERAEFGTTDFIALTPTSPANATTFTDTTAEAGHVYLYRVRALNGGISSGTSNLATSDLDQALRRPTRVEALANSSSQVKLTWKDNASVETQFVIERAQNQPNDWVVIGTAPTNVTTFYDKHVSTGRRYFYRIRATDGSHFSQYSDRATTRALPRFVTAPRAPAALRGKVLSSTSVRLVWKDKAFDETYYSVERSTSLDGGFHEVGKTDVNLNAFIDKQLVSGKTYYYRVRAFDGAIKSSPSNILKIKVGGSSSAKAKTSSVTASAAAVRSTSLFSTKKVSDNIADDVLRQV